MARTSHTRRRSAARRPLRLLDLMALVAAVALTLVSPGIMKAIIPAESLRVWDRRQYVAHLGALVLVWWTICLVPAVLSGAGSRLRRAARDYGAAAILSATTATLFLLVRQVPAVIVLAAGLGTVSSEELFQRRLFDIMEHAPDSCASAVAAGWVILAITGVGRRPSNWLGQLGCLAGWMWIVIGLLSLIVYIAAIPWLTTSGITW